MLRELFSSSAVGVLEQLPNYAKRRDVLIAVPSFHDRSSTPAGKLPWEGITLLGMAPPPQPYFPWLAERRRRKGSKPPKPVEKSILDIAIALESKEFISHSYCQAVIDELWMGRSAQCGMVKLRKREGMKLAILFQLLICLLWSPYLLASLLFPRLPRWVPNRATHSPQISQCALSAQCTTESTASCVPQVPKVLPTEVNDQYEAPTTSYYISAWKELINLLYIPLVKQMVHAQRHTHSAHSSQRIQCTQCTTQSLKLRHCARATGVRALASGLRHPLRHCLLPAALRPAPLLALLFRLLARRVHHPPRLPVPMRRLQPWTTALCFTPCAALAHSCQRSLVCAA